MRNNNIGRAFVNLEEQIGDNSGIVDLILKFDMGANNIKGPEKNLFLFQRDFSTDPKIIRSYIEPIDPRRRLPLGQGTFFIVFLMSTASRTCILNQQGARF